MGLRKRETSFSRGRLPKNNRNGIAANAGIITYILLLAARIPLSRLIGDAGIGAAVFLWDIKNDDGINPLSYEKRAV